MEQSFKVWPWLLQHSQAKSSFTVHRKIPPPHTTLTDVTPEDEKDRVYSQRLPSTTDSYILTERNKNARDTKRK